MCTCRIGVSLLGICILRHPIRGSFIRTHKGEEVTLAYFLPSLLWVWASWVDVTYDGFQFGSGVNTAKEYFDCPSSGDKIWNMTPFVKCIDQLLSNLLHLLDLPRITIWSPTVP